MPSPEVHVSEIQTAAEPPRIRVRQFDKEDQAKNSNCVSTVRAMNNNLESTRNNDDTQSNESRDHTKNTMDDSCSRTNIINGIVTC